MLLCINTVCAQRHDYIWLLGYSSSPSSTVLGGSVLDYNNTPVDTFYPFRDMNLDETNTRSPHFCSKNKIR